MAKLAMNKSMLHKERERLSLYQRVLPSLDLKRRQLILEAGKARAALVQSQEEIKRLNADIGEQLPMLAGQETEVGGLVRVASVELGEENIVGVELPVLKEVQCTVRDYAILAKPQWVDVLVDRLREAVILRVKEQVMAERLRLLDYAVRRTTQRINLFEKILIPTAKNNIQRIKIFLGDAERAAIVRAKISKALQQRQQHDIAVEGIGQ